MGHIYTKINPSRCRLLKDCYGISDGILNWLKNSCIKTKSGEDLVCYHGSPSDTQFAIFNDNTTYGCKSFIGFFSLQRDFAENYTDNGSNLGSGNVRCFAINSKKLFDSKNPACIQFLNTDLPDTIICNGDALNKTSFVDYVRTEKLAVNDYKLDINKFNTLKMFEQVGVDVIGESAWEYSCKLPSDKQLQNKYFLSADPDSNSVFVLGHYNLIRPKALDRKYWNTTVKGFRLDRLMVLFDKAVSTGILTAEHLNKLSQGQPVNIKLSTEEFIKVCSYDIYSRKFTEEDRQNLYSIVDNPLYNDVDLSVDVTLAPQKIDLDEFSQGMATGQVVDNTGETWGIYENSYCIIDDQKIHIIDWLKNAGFDAIIIKECGVVNIICLYKNIIKDIYNEMPTDSDNVFEAYDYSDALLADLI